MASDTLPRSLLVPERSERDGRDAALEAPSKDASATARLDLAQVYEAHADYVFRCLRSLGLNGPQLDDAVQDVFMVVQAKLADFDGGAQLRTWLYAIVLRVARRARERAAQDAARFVPELLDSAAAPSEHEGHGAQLALAHRALGALDPPKREVFVLAVVEELSAPEIAEITGLPLNTVYSRIRAARLAFDEQVARLQRREDAAAHGGKQRRRP